MTPVNKKTVRRRRMILLLLAIVAIALLTISFRESASGGLHAVQRGVMEVLSPLQRGASRALKPARDFIDWSGDVFTAKSENKKLKNQVDQLQEHVAILSTEQKDNQELRGLLDLRDRGVLPSTYARVAARVISRSPTLWYSTLTINKGSGDGLRVDQPVVNAEGLIGKIDSVSGHAAQVLLVADQRSAVSAQVVPDGPAGILKPRVGDPSELVLDFIGGKKKAQNGSIVVTAGWQSSRFESLFPRGLPIGRVSGTTDTANALFKKVRVKLFANLSETDIVEVLRKK